MKVNLIDVYYKHKKVDGVDHRKTSVKLWGVRVPFMLDNQLDWLSLKHIDLWSLGQNIHYCDFWVLVYQRWEHAYLIRDFVHNSIVVAPWGLLPDESIEKIVVILNKLKVIVIIRPHHPLSVTMCLRPLLVRKLGHQYIWL